MKTSVQPRRLFSGYLLSVGLFAAVLLGTSLICLGARFFLEMRIGWRCPALTLTGVPCPSCGSTRALAAISRFELGQALAWNPLLVLAMPLTLAGFALRKWLVRFSPWGWHLFFAAVFLNWVYLFLYLPR